MLTWNSGMNKLQTGGGMSTRQNRVLVFLCMTSLLMASCGSGLISGPTSTPTTTPTLTATPYPTSTPEPIYTSTPEFPTFTKDQGLEIIGASETTGEGEISFEAGASPDSLKLTINGSVQVTEPDAVSWFSLNIIHIAPNLKIPVEFFGVLDLEKTAKVNGGSLQQHFKIINKDGYNVMKQPPEIISINYVSLVLEYPLITDSTNAIISGEDGVTLRREGALFYLVDGSAHLEE